MTTYRVAARVCSAVLAHWVSGASSREASSVLPSTSNEAGSSRRTRRLQKLTRSRGPRGTWPSRCRVMRKPEMTKKTSTPMKPPVSDFGARW
ncbi:hypothetical protein ABIE44_001378 [Marmoricola sp. OAE513]